MDAKRLKAEALIYEFMDKLDPSKANSNYYKELFADMSDEDFLKFVKRKFPYKFHVTPFKIEPTMLEAKAALDVLKVPLLEKVNLNYLYKNKDGKAVQSKECLVCYIPVKKMKQFVTKKNSMSTDISERDMKTGLLVSFDKNGITSDREMEALAIMGLNNTITELAKPRADSMKSKSTMYAAINTAGTVELAELPLDIDESLAKNMISTYLIGSQLYSNLLGDGYYLPHTLNDKDNRIERK